MIFHIIKSQVDRSHFQTYSLTYSVKHKKGNDEQTEEEVEKGDLLLQISGLYWNSYQKFSLSLSFPSSDCTNKILFVSFFFEKKLVRKHFSFRHFCHRNGENSPLRVMFMALIVSQTYVNISAEWAFGTR